MTRSFYILLMLVLLRSSLNARLPAYQDMTVRPRHVVVHSGITPRSEIDLTTEKQVLFCAGQNKSLECVSPGSTIAIMDTFWGRLSDKICPSEDGDPTTNCGTDLATTSLLKNLCDDKVFCEIPARHTVLQAPGTTHCPGVNKYLIVNYTCMPVERKFVLCDGETTNLKCGEEWKLNILSAAWGRMSPATCATTLGRPSRLGKCDSSNSTLGRVRSICHGRNGCVVRADDEHMVQGSENHCPDVDKYAMVSYRCQPNVQQDDVLDSSRGNSGQGFVPENPTKRIPFVNQNDVHGGSNAHHLLQATMPDNEGRNRDPSTESSLDGLLEEYMESQNSRGGDGPAGTQMNVPHDTRPSLPKEVKLGVPQDGAKESLQQNIAMLKKILRSKKIMKVGVNAMEGIDNAMAVGESHRDPNSQLPDRLDLTQDELNHLAQSPDAIRVIDEYMSRNRTSQQVTPLTASHQDTQGPHQMSTSKPADASSNTNNSVGSHSGVGEGLDTAVDNKQHSEQPVSSTAVTTTPTPLPTISTMGTTVKTNQKDLSKLMDPTAKLGGKVMGNMFYEKFLKPAQDDFEKQAKNVEQNSEGKAVGLLRKKVSALQAISDALTLITSKMGPDRAGGKRHHHSHHEITKGLQDLPDSVEPKDVQFLQDKINMAIETTEAMERQAALKNPGLVALRLRGKVAEDVQGEARNRVEQGKQRQKIDKQIKDIEDSFNMLIDKAEKTGKFSDVDVNSKPTSSLFQELQSGALKMPFNNEQLPERDTDNSTKGIYGFEVVNQEPVINIINVKGNATDISNPAAGATIESGPAQTTPGTKNDLDNHEHLTKTLLSTQSKQKGSSVTLAPKTAAKAANSIANALRRQSASVTLKPITTFNNIQDVTLGGRINSEVIKEKEREKLYHGKDVNILLNMIKAKPSSNAQNQLPGKSGLVPGKAVPFPGKDTHQSMQNVPGKAPEVKTVGTLDENSVKLLSVLVQGFLEQNKNRRILKHHRRRKKKKKQKLEEEDFVIGAKHDQMGKNKENHSDKELLDALEHQLASAQRYGHDIKKIVSDSQGKEEGEDDNTLNSVPNDKEKESVEDNSLVSTPTVKPMPAPSDDLSLELVNKYTKESSLDNLLLSLQKMLQQGKLEIEKDRDKSFASVQESSAESASKTSLSSKPRVVQFSAAATSGKIHNSGDETKTTANQDLQKITQFAGGRILEPASSAGMLPIHQDTISIINAKPTTKSKVDAARINSKPTSQLKLKNLVSGVKLLLRALRGKSLESHKTHHRGRLEDDTNDEDDDVDAYPDDYSVEETEKQEQGAHDNEFSDDASPRNKATSAWYVGEGNSYKTGFQSRGYQYDEQYDQNLAQQYATTPKEYSSFTPDIYSGPYTSFALRPNAYGYQTAPRNEFRDPLDKQYSSKLPSPARHALNSALKNDPIIQAVEEFSDNESKLYNEKLRGIQKDTIPQKQSSHNTG